MSNILPAQMRLLHALLNSTGMMPQKESLVAAFGHGKQSSKDLNFTEAGELISYLKTIDASHKMRRKIIRLAHDMGWQLPGKKIDMDRLNGWCKTYGFGKKELNAYTAQELPKLVTQFEKVYNDYLNNF